MIILEYDRILIWVYFNGKGSCVNLQCKGMRQKLESQNARLKKLELEVK